MTFKRHRIDVLGVKIDDLTGEFALNSIVNLASRRNRGKYVVTVNPEFVMKARKDAEFAKILANSDLAVADGIGVVISKLIFGGREHYRITGVDLVEKLCKKSADLPMVVGFLGGFGGVAQEVAKRQKLASPSLKIGYTSPRDETIGSNLRLNKANLPKERLDILFVALGMGKQEFFIDKYRQKLDVGVFIGVGGAFDYLAGVKRRAPKVVQKMGGEWLFRLVMEPVRIFRMRVLPIFFLLVFLEFCKKNIFGKK